MWSCVEWGPVRIRRKIHRNNGKLDVSWNRWELCTIGGGKELSSIVLSVMVLSSIIKGLWLILSPKWIYWKDLGQLMQSPGNLDMEVRVWVAARNVFWNHTAGLILSGPRSDSSAYVMDPADIWPSPGQPALHHCGPWHLSVAACNCHHVQRGPFSSGLFYH